MTDLVRARLGSDRLPQAADALTVLTQRLVNLGFFSNEASGTGADEFCLNKSL
jgi:hypothetical protein